MLVNNKINRVIISKAWNEKNPIAPFSHALRYVLDEPELGARASVRTIQFQRNDKKRQKYLVGARVESRAETHFPT